MFLHHHYLYCNNSGENQNQHKRNEIEEDENYWNVPDVPKVSKKQCRDRKKQFLQF